MVTIPYTGLRPMQPPQQRMASLPVMQPPSHINMQARQAAADALANAQAPQPNPWEEVIGNIANGAARALKAPVAPDVTATNYSIQLPSTGYKMPASFGGGPLQVPNILNVSTPALPAVSWGDSLWRKMGF